MAKEKDLIIPNIKLPKESIDELNKAEAMIPEARRALKALARLGVNVREIESKLDWADEVAKTLKADFV